MVTNLEGSYMLVQMQDGICYTLKTNDELESLLMPPSEQNVINI